MKQIISVVTSGEMMVWCLVIRSWTPFGFVRTTLVSDWSAQGRLQMLLTDSNCRGKIVRSKTDSLQNQIHEKSQQRVKAEQLTILVVAWQPR